MIPISEKKTVRRIEIIAIIVYIVSTAVSLFWGSTEFTIGIAVGGAAAIVNLDLLKRIIAKVFEDPALIKGYYFLVVMLKFSMLGIAVGVLILSEMVRADAFAAGFTVVLIAVFVEGTITYRLGGSPSSKSDDPNGTGAKPEFISKAELGQDSKEQILR